MTVTCPNKHEIDMNSKIETNNGNGKYIFDHGIVQMLTGKNNVLL